MAIIKFVEAQPGVKGDTGPTADRDLNSLMMVSWMTQPIVKGYDFYSNNFSTSKGIDPQSTAIYNTAGYYEPPVTSNDYSLFCPLSSTDDLVRTNYKGSIYRWYQDYNDTGHFEGSTQVVTSGGVAVNKGGGKVGIPCVGQPFSSYDVVEFRGTTYYNGTQIIDPTSSVNEVVITASYLAETFGPTATINKRITLGPGGANTMVSGAMVAEFYDGDPLIIMKVTSSGHLFGQVTLSSTKSSSVISGIYDVCSDGNYVYPASAYTTTASGWSMVLNDVPSPRRYIGPMAYDPLTKDFWMFGGYKFNTATRVNELWRYSTASGQWFFVQPAGSLPAARDSHNVVFDPVNRDIIVWGGYSTVYLNDMWKYSMISGSWTQIVQNGSIPSIRTTAAAVYATISGTILLYGGYNGSVRLNDLYEYNIGTNTWKQIVFSNPHSITLRNDMQYCWQTTSGCMIINGGYTTADTADTFKFD
jgi:hypothetical protein